MEQLAKNIDEIKKLFPDEWVLIGNPVMDDAEVNVLSGVPVLHSKDKKEVFYLGRSKTSAYNTFTVIFTGITQHSRVLTGIFNSTQK
jgi:hypothetical protein